jgi:hypothetical protein
MIRPQYPIRGIVFDIAMHPYFDNFVTFCIVLQVIVRYVYLRIYTYYIRYAYLYIVLFS